MRHSLQPFKAIALFMGMLIFVANLAQANENARPSTSTKLLTDPNGTSLALETLRIAIENEQWHVAKLIIRDSQNDLLGQPEFDWYWGLAHMQFGEYAMAATAFKRVIQHHPKLINAHYQLSRALYLSQQFSAAKQALQTLLTYNLPKHIQQDANALLKDTQEKLSHQQINSQFYANIGFGWASNANLGRDNVTLSSNAQGLTQLPEEPLKESDLVSSFNMGTFTAIPHHRFARTQFQLDLSHQNYHSLNALTQTDLNGLIDFSTGDANQQFIINAGAGAVVLNDDLDEIRLTPAFGYQRTLSQNLQTGISFGRRLELAFNDSGMASTEDYLQLNLNFINAPYRHQLSTEYHFESVSADNTNGMGYHGFATHYQFNWQASDSVLIQIQTQHEWKLASENNGFFTETQNGSDFKTRNDHRFELIALLDKTWPLGFNTQSSIRWYSVNSSINDFDVQNFRVHQTIGVRF